MNEKKILISILVITLISVIFLGGCKQKEYQVEFKETLAENLDDMLLRLDVPYTQIKAHNNLVEIYYEATDAMEYDDQMIADWAMIFGASADFYENIVIITTLDKTPYLKLSTNRSNIRLLVDEKITQQDFWGNVSIESYN
ncbi:MAG TPA: hypothetical protein PLX15_03320 [Candidatus Woesearchaeota archaeon]|nr:hypothetical protein [Candidatus Woesearchaeota archaeon]